MKKTLLPILITCAVAHSVSALNFSVPDDCEGFVWSKGPWVDSSSYLPLKQKPGPIDNVRVQGDIKLDGDLVLKTLYLHPPCVFNAQERKIKIAGKFTMNLVGTSIVLKRSTMDIGGMIDSSKFDGRTSVDGITIQLEDSTLNAGGFLCTIEQPNLNTKTNTGITIDLKGDSLFALKSQMVMDGLLRGDNGSNLFVRFKFSDRNGKMPVAKLDATQLKNFMIDVSVRGDIKKGKYPVLLLKNKASADFSEAKLKFNGKNYTLKTPVTVGELQMTLDEGESGKDGYGLILTVK